jgi:hypothetical protein
MTYNYVVSYDNDNTYEIFRSASYENAEAMANELAEWFGDSFGVETEKPQVHLLEHDPNMHCVYNRHLLRGILTEPVEVVQKPKLLVIEGGVS